MRSLWKGGTSGGTSWTGGRQLTAHLVRSLDGTQPGRFLLMRRASRQQLIEACEAVPATPPGGGVAVEHQRVPADRLKQLFGSMLMFWTGHQRDASGILSEQQHNTRIGFLPPAHTVFKTGGRPHQPGWKVPNLGLMGVSEDQFKDRTNLLSNLDVGIPGLAAAKDAKALASLKSQAEDMLTNPATRKAFDLQAEPLKLREQYGLGHRGQCYLLGRKLIESGVRFVTIDCREPPDKKYPGGSNMNWDHHDHIYSKKDTKIKGGGAGAGRWGIGTEPMMPSTDRAFAALLADMSDRGLLEETLVCFVTEFGRTPKINERLGRDHWTHAFTHVFAGAGVPGGQVVGSTDKDGGYITSPKAYTIEDYGATIFEKLGIDREEPLYTPSDRPIFLAKEGQPIAELF